MTRLLTEHRKWEIATSLRSGERCLRQTTKGIGHAEMRWQRHISTGGSFRKPDRGLTMRKHQTNPNNEMFTKYLPSTSKVSEERWRLCRRSQETKETWPPNVMQRPGTEREVSVEGRLVVCSSVNGTITNVNFLVLRRVHGSVRSYERHVGEGHRQTVHYLCNSSAKQNYFNKATEEKNYTGNRFWNLNIKKKDPDMVEVHWGMGINGQHSILK